MSEDTEEKLSIRELAFCWAYLQNGCNGRKAAQLLGSAKPCSAAMGANLLAKPHVKGYIEKHMRKFEEKMGISVEWKLRLLKETAEASYNGDAHPLGKVNATGVVNAIAEINKMDGDYAPTKNINATVTVNIEMQEKLERLVKIHDQDY